jgi:hypothetical protein
MHNAGVVVVNLEVVGLGPGVTVIITCFGNSDQFLAKILQLS